MNNETIKDLCICEISLVTTYIAHPDDYPMKNKGRYHCGMIYTIKGTEIYHFVDKTIHACPGSVLIIPKNEIYQIDFSGEESVAVTIDFEVANDFSFRPLIIKLKENNNMKTLFNDMLKEWKFKSPKQSAALKSLFYKIISFLILEESTFSNSENYTKIASAIEYLHNHFLDPEFRIENAATASGISKRYFEKLFFAEFKMTPRDYVISQKIHLAKEMLHSEKSSVTHVALSLGYTDIYHFSKIFKIKTGYSPREYKMYKYSEVKQ